VILQYFSVGQTVCKLPTSTVLSDLSDVSIIQSMWRKSIKPCRFCFSSSVFLLSLCLPMTLVLVESVGSEYGGWLVGPQTFVF
jgi:hypothetical protein